MTLRIAVIAAPPLKLKRHADSDSVRKYDKAIYAIAGLK
jgi:hypothetical protein